MERRDLGTEATRPDDIVLKEQRRAELTTTRSWKKKELSRWERMNSDFLSLIFFNYTMKVPLILTSQTTEIYWEEVNYHSPPSGLTNVNNVIFSSFSLILPVFVVFFNSVLNLSNINLFWNLRVIGQVEN